MKRKTTIDAGHGGSDPGAVFENHYEKDYALEFVGMIGDVLIRHGVDLHLTRNKDVYLGINIRANLANSNNSQVFISVHLNASDNKDAQGVETLYYPSEKSKALAIVVHKNITSNKKLYTKDRGIKLRADLGVLRLTKMPAVLVEVGFITNKEDMDIVRKNKKEIAENIAKGVLEYMGIRYVAEKTNEGEVDRMNVPAWQEEAFNKCVEKGVINTPEYWEDKLDKNITVGEMFGIIAKTLK